MNKITKNLGAGILLINSKNELLMLLRDDIPNIPFPNMWDIPGGHVEIGEKPQDTVRREMLEEMNLALGEITLFKVYESETLVDNVFWSRIDLEPEKINLMEGQRIAYFSRSQLKKMKLAFNYNIVVEEFFNFILENNE